MAAFLIKEITYSLSLIIHALLLFDFWVVIGSNSAFHFGKYTDSLSFDANKSLIKPFISPQNNGRI